MMTMGAYDFFHFQLSSRLNYTSLENSKKHDIGLIYSSNHIVS
jgi:hypothetical protein